jgi:isopenicillin-N N-acyltransferase like protein
MKKIRISLLATLMAAVFVMPLHAQNDGYRKAVAHLLQQFEQAFNREDTAALQRLFSDNAVFIPNYGKPIVNPKAIGAFWAAKWERPDGELQFSEPETWRKAKHGYVGNGNYQMIRRNGGEKTIISAGWYSIALAAPPKGSNGRTISEFTVSEKQRMPILVANLTGEGYALGLQHGQFFKKEIGLLVAKWKTSVENDLKQPADSVVRAFFNYAHFDEAIKQWTPELYEEVRGIADGSGQPFHDIMVQSLLDEFWVWQDANKHHCSGIGVPARNGKPAYIAQNMDLEAYTDGFQVLLHLAATDEKPEQYILTYPGCIALNGLNEAGVGACMNTLMQIKAAPTGLPVAFIVRGILNRTKRDDVLQFIQNVPHASGQNYLLGIRDEVFDFEASAHKVVRFDPQNANGTVYHTNHPLANDDLKDWFKNPKQDNSSIRLASVQRRIQNLPVVKDEDLKAALRAKDDLKNPVCRAFDQRGGTFASVVMTLSGNPRLQITAGPPDKSKYSEMGFRSQRYRTRENGWRTLTGRVVDNNNNENTLGEIHNREFSIGTVCILEGEYSLKVPFSCKELRFFSEGMEAKTIVLPKEDTLNVALMWGGYGVEKVTQIDLKYRVKRKSPTQVWGTITQGADATPVRPRVRVEGVDITALADENGTYTLTVPPQYDVLLFESDNYPTRKVLLGDYTSVHVSVSLWPEKKEERKKKKANIASDR